jgi:hypothetical protein
MEKSTALPYTFRLPSFFNFIFIILPFLYSNETTSLTGAPLPQQYEAFTLSPILTGLI